MNAETDVWHQLVVVAIIIIAVVVRGWPRRRNDRWSLTLRVERDRSDSHDDDDPGR
jgi:FtsZ-interacting cell division protein ZipA